MDAAKAQVGRSSLYIPAAKLWFIFISFAINFALPNLLSSDQVGDFGVVNRLVSLLTVVMLQGTVQTVSKHVSEERFGTASVFRTALRLQAFFGGGVCIVYFLGAELLSAFFRDPALAGLIRISALIPLFYSLYALYVGVLNGERRFKPQAILDMGYATLRAMGILGAAALGYGVRGVFIGFASAAGVIMAVALWSSRRYLTERITAAPPARSLVAFAVPIMALILVSQWLLSFDLFWVKRLTDPSQSKALSGAYFALLNLAVMPYMLTISINAIIFPLISRATFISDRAGTVTYIRESLRISMLVAVGLEAVFAASPRAAIRLVYPTKPDYLAYADVLVPLAAAYACLCVVSLMTTIISGSNRPAVSLACVVLSLAAQGVLCVLLIPRWGLKGAAFASAGSFLLAAGAAAAYLFRTFGAGPDPLSLLRIVAAGLAGVAVGRYLDWGGIRFVLEAGVIELVFAATTIALGEVGRRDWHRVRSLLGRRG